MDFSRIPPFDKKTRYGTAVLDINGFFKSKFWDDSTYLELKDQSEGVVVGDIKSGKWQLYKMHEVPRPWKKKLRYCIRLINTVRRKFPKVILEINGLYPTSTLSLPRKSLIRCELMENGPLPDFVMHCGTEMKLKYSLETNEFAIHRTDCRYTLPLRQILQTRDDGLGAINSEIPLEDLMCIRIGQAALSVRRNFFTDHTDYFAPLSCLYLPHEKIDLVTEVS